MRLPSTFRFPFVLMLTLIMAWCSLPSSGHVMAEDDVAYRQAMAKAVRNAANRVLPAIVTVEIVGTAGAVEGEVERDAPTSGVIIDREGYVLASSIVVRKPSASLLVVLPDGRRQAAKVVARDFHRELVLLKTDPIKDSAAVELDTAGVPAQIGQTVIAVGRFGGQPMVSRGVLSATGRLDGIAMQTDARVSPALYGGVLIDLYGRVLGILVPAVAEGVAEDATSWYDSGIAFAIPADVIARKLPRMKSGQDIYKGLIGIVGKTKDPYENNTEIAAVRARSPAEAAGIKPGDRVVSVAGTPVRRHQEIRQVLGSFDAGETVSIVLQRDGKQIEVEVTLADRIPPLQPQRLGIIVAESAPSDTDSPQGKDDSNEQDSATEVVVTAVLPGSPADGSINPGDAIMRINDVVIDDAEVLRRQLISAQPETALTVTLRRDGEVISVPVTPMSIDGPIFTELPEGWQDNGEESDWTIEEFKLAESANLAAILLPPEDAGLDSLGLLVLLVSPGQGAPQEVLKDWRQAAAESGVVMCAIAAEGQRRWQPKEIETVANFASAVLKRAPIDPTAVAVAASGALAGGDTDASDSMALAVAMAQSSTFHGVAVHPQTRPPAMRLKENDPSTSLQILLPIESEDDLPSWGPAVKQVGYPIVLGGQLDRANLARWVRLLQSI